MIRVRQKDTKPSQKSSQWQNWKKLNNKVNKIVLDYNPQSKINIYESKLIKMIELVNEKRRDKSFSQKNSKQ